MSKNSNPEIDEIDFREILAAVWAHKILIFLISVLCTTYAGYQALKIEKKFTAEAIFQLDQNNSSNFNVSGDLASLASIAGLTSGSRIGSASEALLERMSGREFILAAIKNSALDDDPYFNNYSQNYSDPLWKATIKKLIGWQQPDFDQKLLIENTMVNNYRGSVNFNRTEAGAIKISVTHTKPEKAADYANKLMENVRLFVQKENETSQMARLSYLSETLADAVQDMERAQQNLKDYALENSTMAEENFISGSLKLNEIRDEKRKVEDIARLLSILESLIKSGNSDDETYNVLRTTYPLLDDIDFRRILGMSEVISAWTWPKLETVKTVSTTLRDRIKRLDVDIGNIEKNAKVYATNADDLAKFSRDAKIAEATYTVLIEQVKSHSLAAGFQPEIFKVFEYATPPTSASSPNRKIMLVIGAVLGAFLGCALALINPIHWGVYYTKSALLSDTNAKLALNSKPIRRLSRQPMSKIISALATQNFPVLNEANIKLSSNKLIYVFDSGGQLVAQNLVRVLAIQSSQAGRKVLICDTTGKSALEHKNKVNENTSGHSIISVNDNVHILTEANGASFFNSTKFAPTIKSLSKTFDQIFICSTKSNAYLGLMALEEFKPSFVLIEVAQN